MPRYAPNKITYSKEEKVFIKSYYGKIPNTDILKQVNTMRSEPLKMSSLRHQMRRMKLIAGVRLIHWTPEQTAYLIANYETVGNIELAKRLNKLKLTKRKFVKKHIEKKMILLGLKRSPESLFNIKEKHKKAGHYPGRTHAKREGTVHIRIMGGLPHPHIKKGIYFVKQARIVYVENYGSIPKGYMVQFADFDTMNLSPSNLMLKKIGDLTFEDKMKMLKIAKVNIEKMNNKDVGPLENVKPIFGKPDQKIKVVINPKLTLYVKPGTNIEHLMEKYNRPLSLTTF